MAACSVALASTVVAQFLLNSADANGSKQGVTMGKKAYRKIVVMSMLQVALGIGTVAIGGCLAT